MAEGFLLTDAERKRFSEWLEQSADSYRKMLPHFENMPGEIGKHTAAIYKRKIAAFLIVYKDLTDVEPMTLGGD